MKRFYVIIHDDWELMGSGFGNVAYHQYLPALSLMNVAQRLGINLTFMVEVAQQLTFIKYQDANPDIRIQKQLWDNSVQLMKQKGFDVQLHLHPQWINARYENNYFTLNEKWNIGTYPKEFQQQLFTEGIEYIKNLVLPIDKSYKLIAFKGGAWGLQPSESLLETLSDCGIKLVLGIRRNLFIPTLSIDNRGLEENTVPYHPEFKDICKMSKQANGLIVMPLPYYSPNIYHFSKYTARIIKRRLLNKNVRLYYNLEKAPPAISQKDNYHSNINLKFAMRPYETHLKISNESFNYLKVSFDNVFKRFSKIDKMGLPINIECHTKNCIGNFETIERFLGYILDKYGDHVEFCSLAQYHNLIEKNPQLVRYNNSDEHLNNSDEHFSN